MNPRTKSARGRRDYMPLTKAELAEKYEWEERHADECECVYCVMSEMFSRKHEAESQGGS